MANYPAEGLDPYYTQLQAFLGASLDLTTGALQTVAVQTAIAADLAAKAPVSNAGLTGTPTAATPPQGDNSTRIATTQFVQSADSIINITTLAAAFPVGAPYILQNSDAGTEVEFTNAAAVFVQIPVNVQAVGSVVNLRQMGAGQVTITAAGGATVNSPNGFKTRTQYSTVSLIQRTTNAWIVGGDSTT